MNGAVDLGSAGNVSLPGAPPPENWLAFPVEPGEQRYPGTTAP
jgi:hypothetical protein